MKMYRNGDFGEDHLTMGAILEKAGEPKLFEKMSLAELQYLIDNATGINKQMFCMIKDYRAKA